MQAVSEICESIGSERNDLKGRSMFYTFRQNNSFGMWKDPSRFVIIQATTAEEANRAAEQKGMYFNGCREGKDCNCCGDRWREAQDCDGTDAPLVYGKPYHEYVTSDKAKQMLSCSNPDLSPTDFIKVFFTSGVMALIKCNTQLT